MWRLWIACLPLFVLLIFVTIIHFILIIVFLIVVPLIFNTIFFVIVSLLVFFTLLNNLNINVVPPPIRPTDFKDCATAFAGHFLTPNFLIDVIY